MADDMVHGWRIFTGPDGKSRQEPVDFPVSKLLPGKGVELRVMEPGRVADWHTAPRRQIIATISGEGELETGDGQKLRSVPGVVHIVEDLEGQGHITRTIGDQPRVCLFIPLDDDTKL